MVGRRCRFRDCQVKENNFRNMHFFHFPLKNKELCSKWVSISGFTDLFKLTLTQQKNRVICGRHFRDECFMNYKKESITKMAIPTLFRLTQYLALDYEKDLNHPVLIKLEKPTKAHLVPPPGFEDPFAFYAFEIQNNMKIVRRFQTSAASAEHKSPEAISSKRNTEISTEASSEKRFKDASQESSNASVALQTQVQVEFGIVSLDDKEDFLFSDHELHRTSSPKAESKNQRKSQLVYEIDLNSSSNEIRECNINKSMEKNDFDYHESDAFSEATVDRADNNNFTEQIAQLQAALQEKTKSLKACNEEKLRLENRNVDLTEKIKGMERANSELRNELAKQKAITAKHMNLEADYSKLQADHKKLADEHRQHQQQGIQKTLISSSSKRKISSSPALTKAELFNGIRKYVSQSVQALLRMEMFGNTADREYKPDEREAAIDLLRLGENAYEFFSEEWRLRLPTLTMVKSWLNEANKN